MRHRFPFLPLLALPLLVPAVARAQPAASPSQPEPYVLPGRIVETGDAAVRGVADPVVASVEGHPILLSDVGRAAKGLPDNLRVLPFDTLYPVLLDRLVDHQALTMMARRNGYESRPDVQRQIQAATGTILEGAYLADVAASKVTEAMVRDRYNQQYANQPPIEEVHARHILVATEAEARKVIEDLKNGADFITIARVVSKDPDAAKGGDLGFFRRDQVWPAFADAAFALAPGQVAPDPVHNEFGWHVVKVEERRLVAPPTYAETRDQIRQDLLAVAVQQAADQARRQVVIHRFNIDGTEIDPDAGVTGGTVQATLSQGRATDGAASPGSRPAGGAGASAHGLTRPR